MAAAGMLVSGYFLYRQVAKWMRVDVLRMVVLVLFAFNGCTHHPHDHSGFVCQL